MKPTKSSNEGFHPILKSIFDFLDRVIPEPEPKIRFTGVGPSPTRIVMKRRNFSTPGESK